MMNNATVRLNLLKNNFQQFCCDYLTLRHINGIFSHVGFALVNESSSGTRRGLVEEFYAPTDWQKIENINKFFKVIEYILQWHDISDEAKDCLRSICTDSGFRLEEDKISYEESILGEDLFESQFPGGLPFGLVKPDFAITAKEGKQSLKFELKSGIGIIWQDVYPNFDFSTFQAACGINSGTNLALKNALVAMNQTKCEKDFFLSYAKRFGMADNHIPILVPQAWIQWHSSSKKILHASGHLLAKELYRVDFVAFWNNYRYAILIDDIGHYAIKHGDRWIADEKTYSQRLEEDRKLQVEGWKIFRVSNWEIRQNNVLEIVTDLQKFIGFEVP